MVVNRKDSESNRLRAGLAFQFSILMFMMCSCQNGATFQKEEINGILDKYRDLGSFSGSVLIAKDDSVLFQRAVGWANREDRASNTVETKFHLGSIIKIFTQVLILQLDEEGKLNLDDPIGTYLEEFRRPAFSDITIRQVLGHRAGFNDIFVPEYVLNVRSYKTIRDKLGLLLDEPLLFPPGTGEKYSNYGYVVLGAIIEHITGKSFKETLRERILSPLGMLDTDYDIAENIPGAAKSYRFLAPDEIIGNTALLEYPTPDGGGYATARDLYRFVHAFLYSGKLLPAEYKSLLVSEYATKSEHHWKDFLNGSALISEAGGGPGISSIFRVLVKDRYCIIVLANYDNEIASSVAYRITDASLGKEYPEPRLSGQTVLYQDARANGWDHVLKHYDEVLKQGGYENLEMEPPLLNKLGYDFLWGHDIQKAKAVFQANIELFPDSPGSYDSMGEAYYYEGKYGEAKTMYEKALSIDPGFSYSKRMLNRLRRKYPDHLK